MFDTGTYYVPNAKDVLRSFPLRNTQEELLGFSIDRVVLHPSERGLVGFSMGGKLHFYNVTPFGAVFSASWWARLGGWILRAMHLLLWFSHAGFLYVDDFLFFQHRSMMPTSAALLLIFCQILCIPISWKKCELSPRIQWIGWQFDFHSGTITLPLEKLERLRSAIRSLQQSSRTTRKALEKYIGLLMWVTQLFPYLRIWVHWLYKDLFTIPTTRFSVDPGQWPTLHEYLNDDLTFHTQPPFSAIPPGSKLLAVRHQPVSSKHDLTSVRISTSTRLWLRIHHSSSNKRKLSMDSQRTLSLYSDWLANASIQRPTRRKPYWPGEAAADASASGETTQLGGFLHHSNGTTCWFSEKNSLEDFQELHIPAQSNVKHWHKWLSF